MNWFTPILDGRDGERWEEDGPEHAAPLHRWRGKKRYGQGWMDLGFITQEQALAEMDRLDLREIATDEGLETIP